MDDFTFCKVIDIDQNMWPRKLRGHIKITKNTQEKWKGTKVISILGGEKLRGLHDKRVPITLVPLKAIKKYVSLRGVSLKSIPQK